MSIALAPASPLSRIAVRETLRGIWSAELGLPESALPEDAGFFESGGFSLLAISMVAKINAALGTGLAGNAVLLNPSLSALEAHILGEGADRGSVETRAGTAPAFVRWTGKPEEPFGLTELQQGYWIGETQTLELSGPGYFYAIYEAPALDVAKLERTLNRLIARHESLRATFPGDALHATAPAAAGYSIGVVDGRGLGEAGIQERIRTMREEIVHNRIPLDAWPTFAVRVLQTESRAYVFTVFKLITADGRSGEIFASEWAALMADEGARLPELQVAFKDYIHSMERYRSTPSYAKSLAYWKREAATLPPSPELPLKRHLLEAGTFIPMTRRTVLLDKPTWSAFRQMCQTNGMTPSMAICSAFCSVLAYWSRSGEFTINLMYANRPPLHEQINDVIGNFSSTLLLAHAWDPGESFLDKSLRLQAKALRHLEHGAVGGVTVIREMNAASPAEKPKVMPVVFASGLGLGSGQGEEEPLFLEKMGWEHVASGINTPQVHLDHQIAENRGRLQINWDSRDSLFPEGMVEDMFSAYVDLLRGLAKDAALWRAASLPLIPPRQLEARRARNATATRFPSGDLLHSGFLVAARKHPEAIAVLHRGDRITYRRLDRHSDQVARRILAAGMEPGRVVAVLCEKHWLQVSAVLGVLKAGCAYLPISASTPPDRIRRILGKAGVDTVLASTDLAGRVPAGLGCLPLTQDPPDGPDDAPLPAPGDEGSLAYVIYTSGSTGDPKGVSISHRAAMNTLHDVGARFALSPADRVLAVSELNFDLSVFDLFGTFLAGGTVVMPDEAYARNPIHLGQLVEELGVTVWNTVPAYMEMLMEAVRFRSSAAMDSVRLVMLSGDWIPLGLPEKIRSAMPQARLVSLGGATEASIWSNYFEIGAIDPAWKSIPYGYPLANQRFHVLDGALRPRPDGVPGELYIAGDGLATGYYRDPERTAESFFTNPHDGERLYRTGDWGQYWPDGTLEFLGRQDTQVKIRGFRIELGEIDAALLRTGMAAESLSLVAGSGGNREIASFVVLRQGIAATEGEIRKRLESSLPSYMVPARVRVLEALPLTPNGKIDRKRLLAGLSSVRTAPARAVEATGTARSLERLMREAIGSGGSDLAGGFFEAGGNSILAVRLMNRIEEEFDKRLPISLLYEHPTAEALAARLEAWDAGQWSPLVDLSARGKAKRIYCLHPIGGNVLCYAPLARALGEDFDLHALQARGLAPGLSPHATIGKMAAYYADRIAAREKGTGQINLLGWSMGGLIALEVRRRLAAEGFRCRCILVDTWMAAPGRDPREYGNPRLIREFFKDLLGGRDALGGRTLRGAAPVERVREALAMLREGGDPLPGLDEAALYPLIRVYEANFHAIMGYYPDVFLEDAVLIRAARQRAEEFPFFAPLAGALQSHPSLQVLEADEDHFSVIRSAGALALLKETAKARF